MKTKYYITSMVMLVVGLIVCEIRFAQLPTASYRSEGTPQNR